MAQIPDLTEYNLIHCTMCALVDGGIEISDTFNIQTKTKFGKQFLVAFSHPSGEGSGSHLHVEIAIEEWFEGSRPPRNGTKKSFDQIIDANKGKKCDSYVSGTFRVPYSSLPENSFVVTAAKTRSAGVASMRMTGASLTITGTPFKKLRWSLVDDMEDGSAGVDIFLRGRMKLVLSDACFVEAVNFLTMGLATFVFGGKHE